MPQLRYICCQPAVPYYTWQIEVMLTNFLRMSIDPNQIDVLLSINNDHVPDVWRRIQQKFSPVRFFFYNDTRPDKSYIPSIYFHLLENHFRAVPSIAEDVLFMHDSDIVFTRPPNFLEMVHDKYWYLSDTNSYINYDYIISKGQSVYDSMCALMNMDPLIPKLMNANSGGAQYIVKNTTADFWRKVESDAVKLYAHFNSTENQYVKQHEGDYPIQKWTAGMWSVLWNAWAAGHATIVDKRLDFGWVTNHISDIERHCILHNAGVTDSKSGLFYKGEYINKLPYGENIQVDPERASSFYWQEVCRAAENTVLMEPTTPGRPIYTANLMGGLGNQLFQIAHGYAQSLKNSTDFVLPTNSYIHTHAQGRASGNSVNNYMQNILRDFRFVDHVADVHQASEPSWEFNSVVFENNRNTAFNGYFQSSKNFYGYDNDIKSRFRPSNDYEMRARTQYPQLNQLNTLAVHVRRGDCLYNLSTHPVLSKQYIQRVVERFYTNYSHVFIFSDDTEWVRNNLNLANSTVVVQQFDYEDLWLMSLCQNHIISNSTFSWWGSYLSNQSGLTCAPSVWFGPHGPQNYRDIYQANWIVVPSEYRDGEIICQI